jgi:hypothetical protein
MTAHLTSDELVRWRDAGSAMDRERVVTHLAACDACGAAYMTLLDTAPVEAPPAVLRRDDFLSRGTLAGGGHGRLLGLAGRRLGRPWRAIAGLAAAAVLVIALLPGLRNTLGTRVPTREPDTIRATTLLLVAPVGETTVPFEFTWRSPVQATRYRVDVMDDDRRLLRSLTTNEERAPLTPELQSLLIPGARYQWSVTALDERGEPLLGSRFESFLVRPPNPSDR